MEVLACLNGEIMPIERAMVPVWDRGFLFGDSVYEVFRMYDATSMARGRASRTIETKPCASSNSPRFDLERLVERMDRTVARSRIREGTVYVQVTRGVAPGHTSSRIRR